MLFTLWAEYIPSMVCSVTSVTHYPSLVESCKVSFFRQVVVKRRVVDRKFILSLAPDTLFPVSKEKDKVPILHTPADTCKFFPPVNSLDFGLTFHVLTSLSVSVPVQLSPSSYLTI